MVLGGGCILSNTTPVYGSVQRTYINLVAQSAGTGASSSYPFTYKTDATTSNSNINFPTTIPGFGVACHYSVKLIGYQKKSPGVTPPGAGIFYGDYNFTTFLDIGADAPTLLDSQSNLVIGATTDYSLPSTITINKFSDNTIFDTAPVYLYADIATSPNRLVLKVNTASAIAANWTAQIDRNEIASAHYTPI